MVVTVIIVASPSSSSRSAGSSRPAERERFAPPAPGRSTRSSGGSASRWRATVSPSPRATGPVSASAGAEGVDVVDAWHAPAAGAPRAAPRRRRRRAPPARAARPGGWRRWWRRRGTRARSPARDPERAEAERQREAFDRRRARRPRTTSPGAVARPTSGDGKDWRGWSAPTSTSGRAACNLSSSSSGQAPERCTTSAPARRPGGERGGGVGDDGVGRGDDHQVGVAAGVGDLAIRGAPSRSAAARVDGAAELRPATATAVQPRADERGGDGRPGATGTDEGERPLRSTLHVHLCVSLPLRSSPGAGAGLLGRRQS